MTPSVLPTDSRLSYVLTCDQAGSQTNWQKAQFNGMPKVFEKSVTEDLKVLDNPEVVSSTVISAIHANADDDQKPPSVQFALAQNYTMKTPKTDKLVNSKITLHVDPSTNLITKYVSFSTCRRSRLVRDPTWIKAD